MLCALTVRRLKPGTFEAFRAAFMRYVGDEAPEGWKQFAMVRGTSDPDEVVCFGFFDGTAEELRASSASLGRAEQLAEIAASVDAVVVDDLFEVVEQLTA
ncbi:MAG: hypothetical protein Q8O56_01645 [Solirubrobacteraceae bacterium]|nr:hypothetical protein [Solirubrobacteraceae bacterium]